MHITVKLFARFKEAAGTGKLSAELPDKATVSDLVESLREKFDGITLTAEQTILSVNQEFAVAGTILNDGDEVAIFPPVSGGSGHLENANNDKFALTYKPISADQVHKMVAHPHTGAVVSFVGLVRNVSEGKSVSSLEYEAYHEMAIAKMKQVVEEARQQWPDIVDAAIVQRIGHLEVGDVAVVIAVSSGHRNQGCFEACQYSINRLKEIVPIWKKEIGPDGEEWIEGEHNPSIEN